MYSSYKAHSRLRLRILWECATVNYSSQTIVAPSWRNHYVMKFFCSKKVADFWMLLFASIILRSSSFGLTNVAYMDHRVSKNVCAKTMASSNDEYSYQEKKRLKVLCLHGYLSSSKYFRLQLRRLVEDGGDFSDFGNSILVILVAALSINAAALEELLITLWVFSLSIVFLDGPHRFGLRNPPSQTMGPDTATGAGDMSIKSHNYA